jgi:hypothetical protein
MVNNNKDSVAKFAIKKFAFLFDKMLYIEYSIKKQVIKPIIMIITIAFN